MTALVEDKREDLHRLCERFQVKRLDLFGSAADGTFDPQRSDLDFLVEFRRVSPAEHYDAYFGLWESLEAMFRRRVDLVEPGCIRNAYVQRRVNESRTCLYAA